MWSLRKLVGDNNRESKLIANRRGVAYFLDLGPEQVEILEHGLATLDDPPGESKESGETIHEPPITSIPIASTAAANATLMARRPRRSFAIAGLVAGVSAAIVLSWLAGSWLSDKDEPRLSALPDASGTSSTSSPNERNSGPDDNSKARKDRRGRDDKGRHRGKKGSSSGTGGAGGAPTMSDGIGTPISIFEEDRSGDGLPSGDSPRNPKPDSRDKPSGGGKNNPPDDEPEEVPPQPSITLYHLVHPDTEDHYATTSSSTASQKEAAGYRSSNEGRVFSSREAGTVAISLSDGTAYIYKDSSSAPAWESLAELYRVNADGDSYYTSSTSELSQAKAHGWSHSTVGYVGS